jgi:hypothetical protein
MISVAFYIVLLNITMLSDVIQNVVMLSEVMENVMLSEVYDKCHLHCSTKLQYAE